MIIRDADGHIIGFGVSGHTRIAPHGLDIVCAGISALSQSAVLGLEKHLGRKVHADVGRGKLDMALKDAPDGQSDAILETMLLGLQEIAKLYPKSVHIAEHRR